MNWQQVRQAVADRTFFVAFDSLTVEQRQARVRWMSLLKTEAIWRWLNEDAWPRKARDHNDPLLHPLLALMLRRNLTNLEVRVRPEPLFDFWDWVCGQATTDDVRLLWRRVGKDLIGSTPNAEPKLRDVREQERRFAQVLRYQKEVLRSTGVMNWAVKAVDHLVAGRDAPPAKQVTHSYVRVVFAWDAPMPEDFREALIVEFELGSQGRLLPGFGPPLEPAEPFKDDFRSVVEAVRKDIGAQAFHQLKLMPLTEELDYSAFPPGELSGTSGGLALYASEFLANPPDGSPCRAVPPWVCMTAVIDTKADRALSPVLALANKVKVLAEEGVRVVAVADDERQVEDAKAAGPRCMKIIPCFGRGTTAVETLIDGKCTWEANLAAFKPLPPVTQGYTRRQIITAAAAAASVTAPAAVAGWVQLTRPPRKTMAETAAMKHHRVEEMRERKDEVIDFFRNHPNKVEDFFHKHVHALEVDSVSAARTSLRGLEVLRDSKFFDSIDWERTSAQEVTNVPVEPAYFTRVLTLRRTQADRTEFVQEFNTSGFAVIPLVPKADPKSKVYYRLNKVMNEAATKNRLTRTTYLEMDISKYPLHQEFDLVIRAIYFNGAQDQIHRRHPSGRPYRFDWFASRVLPGTSKADLAVRLPADEPFRPPAFMIREETEGGLTPPEEVLPDDPEFGSASYRKDNLFVWDLPCKMMEMNMARTAVKQPWIYSVQWRWAAKS